MELLSQFFVDVENLSSHFPWWCFDFCGRKRVCFVLLSFSLGGMTSEKCRFFLTRFDKKNF